MRKKYIVFNCLIKKILVRSVRRHAPRHSLLDMLLRLGNKNKTVHNDGSLTNQETADILLREYTNNFSPCI